MTMTNKTLRVRVWGDQGGWALANLEWWCMQVFIFIGGLHLLRDNFSADTSFFKVVFAAINANFQFAKFKNTATKTSAATAECRHRQFKLRQFGRTSAVYHDTHRLPLRTSSALPLPTQAFQAQIVSLVRDHQRPQPPLVKQAVRSQERVPHPLAHVSTHHATLKSSLSTESEVSTPQAANKSSPRRPSRGYDLTNPLSPEDPTSSGACTDSDLTAAVTTLVEVPSSRVIQHLMNDLPRKKPIPSDIQLLPQQSPFDRGAASGDCAH
ncbi:hypothetical protein B0H65DRAFT_536879 [Neurospora tetraspora]|uniref:Uncharacterized protein n=1 Tax=Neurospora tetraspora TaxID=94610 RepID=A0AAE0MTI7_9PEZI|nr:hypothetical protein B0H65DRAFT_536879 [Neurospora tetraspora]